jgi:hypothetical protein
MTMKDRLVYVKNCVHMLYYVKFKTFTQGDDAKINCNFFVWNFFVCICDDFC